MTQTPTPRNRWSLIGPGIVVAATGVGAGDLVATLIAGSRFGYALLWAAVIGTVLKIALAEAVGRWTLSSERTMFEGWSSLGRSRLGGGWLDGRLNWAGLYFGVYVAVWGFVYGAAAMTSTALPLAALGHDPALMILIAVMGTGFCQTMMASAKPVAIFGNAEEAGFDQRDLIRLALPLAPAVTALLIGFALLVWPQQLAQLRPSDAPRMQPAASLVAPAVALVPARAAPAVDATRPVPRPALAARPAARKAAPARRQADPGLQRLNRLLRPAGIRLIIR